MKKLTIQRLGGMLPALRPSVSHAFEALDEAQQQALAQWLPQAGRARRAAHAEAMNYVFTLHDDDGPGAPEAPLKVSAPFAEVPEALRGLLPAAGAVRGGPKGPGKGAPKK